METKFTKGKWAWKQTRGNNYYEHKVYAENGNTIADLQVGTVEEVKANAKLIASAPDLLEALQLLHEATLINATHKGFNYLETNTGKVVIDALKKATE